MAIAADIAVHAADIDAHMADLFQKLEVGNYYAMGLLTRYESVLLTITANQLYGRPFIVARDMTVDRIAIHVTTAGAAGKVVRLGIYNDGTNVYPGTLVLDAGTVIVDTTGVKAININQSLTKGLYWVACISDGGPIIRDVSPAWSPIGNVTTDFSTIIGAWRSALAYAALPTPFTAGGVIRSDCPAIYMRVASLD